MDFTIRKATLEDAEYLAPRLRQSDIREVKASSGMYPLEALQNSVQVSDEDLCWAAELDGEVVAMFGANHVDTDIGGIWLLASKGIYKNPKGFMRHSREVLTKAHERYRYLTNWIDCRNQRTLKWLTKLGFRSVQVRRFGKVPFVQFVSQRGTVNV